MILNMLKIIFTTLFACKWFVYNIEKSTAIDHFWKWIDFLKSIAQEKFWYHVHLWVPLIIYLKFMEGEPLYGMDPISHNN